MKEKRKTCSHLLQRLSQMRCSKLCQAHSKLPAGLANRKSRHSHNKHSTIAHPSCLTNNLPDEVGIERALGSPHYSIISSNCTHHRDHDLSRHVAKPGDSSLTECQRRSSPSTVPIRSVLIAHPGADLTTVQSPLASGYKDVVCSLPALPAACISLPVIHHYPNDHTIRQCTRHTTSTNYLALSFHRGASHGVRKTYRPKELQ